MAHNRLPAADQVGQISYFLEESAREVYDTEVNDRVQALMMLEKGIWLEVKKLMKRLKKKQKTAYEM